MTAGCMSQAEADNAGAPGEDQRPNDKAGPLQPDSSDNADPPCTAGRRSNLPAMPVGSFVFVRGACEASSGLYWETLWHSDIENQASTELQSLSVCVSRLQF